MGQVATFYALLGVDSNASPEEIERAYRVRVKETHPDLNDDADGEAFKRLTTAREILLEEELRDRYDRLGHDRYVHRNLNPENWPDVGERPPRRPRGSDDRQRHRRSDSSRSRTRGRTRSRTRRRRRQTSTARASRSYTTARAGRTATRGGVGVRHAHTRAPFQVHVSHSPQRNPYTTQNQDVVELAAVVQRALYGVLVCSFAITALTIAIVTLFLFSLG